MSETCRVIINQVKQKLHLVGYLPIQLHTSSVGMHEGKKYLVTVKLNLEEHITVCLKDTGYDEVNSIYLAQNVAVCRENDADS